MTKHFFVSFLLFFLVNANFRLACEMNYFNGCGTSVDKFTNIYKFCENDNVHMDELCNMCTNNECLISPPYFQDDDVIFTYICVHDNTMYLVGGHNGNIANDSIRGQFNAFLSANATEIYGPGNICVISISGHCLPY